MQLTTTQSATQTQPAAESARQKFSVEVMHLPDVFADDSEAKQSDTNDVCDIELPEIAPVGDPVKNAIASHSDLWEEKIVKDFRNDVVLIQNHAAGMEKAVRQFARNCDAAVYGTLAKIHGMNLKYFVAAPAGQIKFLLEELGERTKVKVTRRTEAPHLLSRLYRGADRQKASADAKVLIAACEETEMTVTEENFVEWLAKKGGYNAVVKGIDTGTMKSRANKPSDKPMAKTQAERKKWFKTAVEALDTMKRSGQMKEVFAVDTDSFPEMCERLMWDSTQGFRMLVAAEVDGKLVFHSFYPDLMKTVEEHIPKFDLLTEIADESAPEVEKADGEVDSKDDHGQSAA
jgi:hypothetical protein